MPIESHHLLTLAEELGARPDEASRRSSISRAYYAAYHRCLAWEESLPHHGDDGGLHGLHARLIGRLLHPAASCSTRQAKRSMALAKLLNQQRGRRVAADYKLDEHVSQASVRAQLDAAKAVLLHCDAHLRHVAPRTASPTTSAAHASLDARRPSPGPTD
ncbi:hypothetical protein [Roseateles sp. MS654]|uniref:hypothetical protein n=1 Tax=Roseateles sp. MS654 TaxID=3412685 RepID=UPI003C2B4484